MRILAIDSATEACSAALFDDGDCIGHFHEVIGRGHAERLVPGIAALPDKGRAERILVSLGPGSFTGVRIGLAAARALGLAWEAEVLGYPTLALVAAQSWQPHPRPVTVCMNGGHGEWFVQNFDDSWLPQDDLRSLPPAEAVEACTHKVIVGNKAKAMAELIGPPALGVDMLPDARRALLVGDQLLTTNLSPIYGRAPDAKLPGSK